MKVLIVEDHVIFSELLAKLCTQEFGVKIVGQTGSGAAAIEIIRSLRPDLIFLDLSLSDLDGFRVAEEAARVLNSVKIIVLSAHLEESTLHRVEKLPVHGFVEKSGSMASLREAFEAVKRGEPYYSQTFRAKLIESRCNNRSFLKLLSPTQQDVLSLIGGGMNDVEIAARMAISEKTSKKHRSNIFKKLGIPSTSKLMVYAQDRGLTLTAPRARIGHERGPSC